MKEQFVPYEIALKLKELGFYEECLAFYLWQSWNDSERLEIGDDSEYKVETLSAPLWQQTFDWFRIKHLLHSSIDFSGIKEKDDNDVEYFYYQINEQWSLGKDFYDYSYGFKHVKYESHFTTYKEARLACLEKLIEIIQNK